jgi:alpha-glucosidase
VVILLAPLAGFAQEAGIRPIEPREAGFYAKRLDYDGIPIKAPKEVVDEALLAAQGRLSMLLSNVPAIRENLRRAGTELHIIGRDQVTSDLPEHRNLKGKPLPEYHGLTVDERTRGLGGRLVSCGEENLLKLEKDRYRGRDICVHEFAHAIRNYGMPREVRSRFDSQYQRSLAGGLWQKSYAGSNADEFFAELSMWYFGTHGDLHMNGPKPENGPTGLRKYDPDVFALLEDFYSGHMAVPKTAANNNRSGDDAQRTNSTGRP